MTFTAIDFETAQGRRWSICQVGLVRVVEGRIVHEISQLVRPPDNFYWPRWSELHGITAQDTVCAPDFAEVWPVIEPFITGQEVVAHNASFDLSCLRQTLELYRLPVPHLLGRCTYRIYRKGLAELCHNYGISLDHHHALSDARACAELYRRHLGNAAKS